MKNHGLVSMKLARLKGATFASKTLMAPCLEKKKVPPCFTWEITKILGTSQASHIWELTEINSGLHPDPYPGHSPCGPNFGLIGVFQVTRPCAVCPASPTTAFGLRPWLWLAPPGATRRARCQPQLSQPFCHNLGQLPPKTGPHQPGWGFQVRKWKPCFEKLLKKNPPGIGQKSRSLGVAWREMCAHIM